MMKLAKRAEIKDIITVVSEALAQHNENGDAAQRLQDTAQIIALYQNAAPETKKTIDTIFGILAKKTFGTLQRESMETFRNQQLLADNISNLIKLSDSVMYEAW